MKQNAEILSSCDLQFGFKPNHSTMQCTFVMNEIIQYYRNKNSDVSLCPLICRLLYCIYARQTFSVRWGGKSSRLVSISNGIRQGGILSPTLFTIYMDSLFSQLRLSGFGCHIGNSFMGAVGYADDVAILAQSVQSLKKNIGDSFGKYYSVLFNVEKYQLLHYSTNKEVI